MKISSILFSLLILFLSLRPCCTARCCEDDVCTIEMKNNPNHSTEDTNPCSPFFSCGNCLGFTFLSSVFMLIPEALELNSIYLNYHSVLKSKPSEFIWQPPKMLIYLL